MSSQPNSIYNEKKLAYYESSFKFGGAFSKPQDVNLTLTADHIYGLAYLMEQTGTKEGDPVYTRFICTLDEITKIFINENSKQSPLYIQCDTVIKGALSRKRIIVPCLKKPEEAMNEILEAKKQFEEKAEKAKERTKARQKEQLQKLSDSVDMELTAPARDAHDKAKDYESIKKAADTFFDNIPVPKNPFGKPPAPEKKEEGPSAEETAAAEVSESVAETAEETSVNVPAYDETETVSAPAYASTPELAAAVEAAERAVDEIQQPPIKSLPRVTAEDLKKLNDLLDLDFIQAVEPPITRAKPNASRYLDDIGSDYKPPEHTEETVSDTADTSEISLENMDDYTGGNEYIPDLNELRQEVGRDNILLSDMSGEQVNVEEETAEEDDYTSFFRKSKPDYGTSASETADIIARADAVIADTAEVMGTSDDTAAAESEEVAPEVSYAAEEEAPADTAVTENITYDETVYTEAEEIPVSEEIPVITDEAEAPAGEIPVAAEEAPVVSEEAEVPAEDVSAAVVEERFTAEEPAVPAEEVTAVPEETVGTAEEYESVIADTLTEEGSVAAEDAFIEEETVTAEEPSAEEIPSEVSAAVREEAPAEEAHGNSLEEFEDAVRKLKAKLDEGLITKEEFKTEKKKLMATLY